MCVFSVVGICWGIAWACTQGVLGIRRWWETWH